MTGDLTSHQDALGPSSAEGATGVLQSTLKLRCMRRLRFRCRLSRLRFRVGLRALVIVWPLERCTY